MSELDNKNTLILKKNKSHSKTCKSNQKSLEKKFLLIITKLAPRLVLTSPRERTQSPCIRHGQMWWLTNGAPKSLSYERRYLKQNMKIHYLFFLIP